MSDYDIEELALQFDVEAEEARLFARHPYGIPEAKGFQSGTARALLPGGGAAGPADLRIPPQMCALGFVPVRVYLEDTNVVLAASVQYVAVGETYECPWCGPGNKGPQVWASFDLVRQSPAGDFEARYRGELT
jgi:hypothetical protein